MQSEIEAKFLDQNHDAIRAKLQDLGAECEQPMRLMRRVTIETPEMIARNGWLRVRDEGHRTTMTYKQTDALTVDGTKEVEVVVSDFDETVKLLEAAGLAYNSFQESKRETWQFDDVEIVLDEWPWLKPYIEIEGSSEQQVRDTATALGLDWNDAQFGDVMVVYRTEYPHLTINDTLRIPEVKFGDPLPDLLKDN